MTVRGAVLVVGTASGAGKSTVTAGLCRWLARHGCGVAPFKAQNMSNHAAVAADGGEVGRAQAMQAAAAGVDVETAMNPLLLKPSSVTGSHVIVRGRPAGTTDAGGWGRAVPELRRVVLDSLTSLRRRFDVVVAEGAGGAAEINLLERDLVNLPLARAAGIPAVLITDIGRGGAFAAAHGTVDLLPQRLRRTIAGIVLNGFRGDPALLTSGIAELEHRTGVPVLGVLPHLGPTPMLGGEDSLDVGAPGPSADDSPDPLRVAVVRLPHLSNPSDLDPLLVEPDVSLTWASRPADLRTADLVVLPGSRATVADLGWLRRCGIAQVIIDRVGSGRLDVLAICYQIHHGRCRSDEDGWVHLDGPGGVEVEGSIGHDGRVLGTSLHGVLDADGWRSAHLGEIARRHGRSYVPSPVPFASRLESQHERLANWIERDLDTEGLLAIVQRAVAPGQEPGW